MNIASPRSGSPRVTAAACARRSLRSSTASPMTATATTKRVAPTASAAIDLAGRDRMVTFACLERGVEQDERRPAVDDAAWYPHDEARQLLVRRRVEADARQAHGRISRVPGARRQGHQGAERSLDQGRHEEAGGGKQVAAPPRVE